LKLMGPGRMIANIFPGSQLAAELGRPGGL
jgi:hypothetical protein